MRGMQEFGELAPEDKAKVIGGLVCAGIMLPVLYVFTQYYVVEDRFQISSLWESGMSGFSISRMLLPTLYFVVALPASIPGTVIGAWLTKHSVGFILKSILSVLLLTAAAFGLVALMLTIFDLLFSNLLGAWQIPLIALASSSPLMIIGGMLKTEKTRALLRKCGMLKDDEDK